MIVHRQIGETKFFHGDRVELLHDLDELIAGMRGVVHIDDDRIGVWFDGMCSISIGRIPDYPNKNEYVPVINCVKKI